MSQLSSWVRKNKKKLKKAAVTGLRVIAAGVTKGKSEKVIQNLKGIGAAVKTYKGLTKKPTKAGAAHQAKVAVLTPPKIVPISAQPATTMPGGKKLSGVTVTGSTARKRPAVAAAKPKKARRAKKPAKPATVQQTINKGRRPPKGGLDLKALSASWKAAGKPGTWQGWIASHK